MQDSSSKNKSIMTKTLGLIVERHRKQQGKTIYKISAEAAMSKSTWREAELGMCKNITLATLWKIAEGLNISLSSLMDELSAELGPDFTLTDID